MRDAKRRIGYLPENNPLYADMLVVEYLGFVAELRELAGVQRRSAIDDAVAATRVGEGSAWPRRFCTGRTSWCSTSRRRGWIQTNELKSGD
jgi:ABC-type multidrug transport system ATPase subunit